MQRCTNTPTRTHSRCQAHKLQPVYYLMKTKCMLNLRANASLILGTNEELMHSVSNPLPQTHLGSLL